MQNSGEHPWATSPLHCPQILKYSKDFQRSLSLCPSFSVSPKSTHPLRLIPCPWETAARRFFSPPHTPVFVILQNILWTAHCYQTSPSPASCPHLITHSFTSVKYLLCHKTGYFENEKLAHFSSDFRAPQMCHLPFPLPQKVMLPVFRPCSLFSVAQRIGGGLRHLRFSVEVSRGLCAPPAHPPRAPLSLTWRMTSKSSASHDELRVFIPSNAKVNRELRFEKANHL